jgi:hypothetical protein
MRLAEALRAAWSKPDCGQGCAGCARFRNDPVSIEAALPGINSFSSAHASVRADDGLCTLHGLLINGRRGCADYLCVQRV